MDFKARIHMHSLINAFTKNPTPTTLALVVSVIADTKFPDDLKQEAFQGIVDALRHPPGALPRASPNFPRSDKDPTDPTDSTDPTENEIMATQAILTPAGVTSFLTLKEPRAIVPGGEERYSINLIFDKAAQKTLEFRKLQEACDAALKDKWPGKLPAGLRSPFHDGAEKEDEYDGYKAGDIFISPWSKNKPGCVNRDRQEILDWSEFYAGWTARAFVRPFAYDTGGNRGCSMFLDVVQFLKPGPRLDGRKNAIEAFPDDQSEDADERV